MDEQPESPTEQQTPEQRRHAGIVLLVVVVAFVIYDVFWYLDLVRNGSTEDLEHASERIGDLSTGPNAP